MGGREGGREGGRVWKGGRGGGDKKEGWTRGGRRATSLLCTSLLPGQVPPSRQGSHNTRDNAAWRCCVAMLVDRATCWWACAGRAGRAGRARGVRGGGDLRRRGPCGRGPGRASGTASGGSEWRARSGPSRDTADAVTPRPAGTPGRPAPDTGQEAGPDRVDLQRTRVRSVRRQVGSTCNEHLSVDDTHWEWRTIGVISAKCGSFIIDFLWFRV